MTTVTISPPQDVKELAEAERMPGVTRPAAHWPGAGDTSVSALLSE